MKKRVISAAVMMLIFIPCLLIGGNIFNILLCILAVLGLHELLEIRKKECEKPLIMRLFAYITLVYICMKNISSIEFHYSIGYKSIAMIIFIFLFPIVFYNDNKKYNISDALYLIGSVLFLGFSFNLLIITRNYDLYRIIYLLLLSTMTDTFAYITGKLVGTHKLAPKISPNKTIEGLIGGLVMGTFIATSFYHVFINTSSSLVIVSLITLLLSVVGQIGDLVFSMIKRYYNKKDFSNLIPGHGGILDRFDSIIFIALAFILVADVL